MEPTPDHSAKIAEALLADRKIEAIKLYREQTGLGLKESKEAVEKLEVELRQKHPEAFANRPAKSGCAGLVVFGLIGAAALGAIGQWIA